MSYTMKNAAMSLADARQLLANPQLGWSASQIARAKAVAAHWARIRASQQRKRDEIHSRISMLNDINEP